MGAYLVDLLALCDALGGSVLVWFGCVVSGVAYVLRCECIGYYFGQMAESITDEAMTRAEEIRGANLDYDQRTAIELRNIYNRFSGDREYCCLCTKGRRNIFKKKFYTWYDFR